MVCAGLMGSLVPRKGLEPLRDYSQRILSPSRLPIPPPRPKTIPIIKRRRPELPDLRFFYLLEATGGFEPPIEVLQTPALTTWLRRPGAEDGIRTRDPLLGKEMLYH